MVLIAQFSRVIRNIALPLAIILASSSAPALAFDGGDGTAARAAPRPGKQIAQLVTIRPKPGMEAALADRLQGLAGPTRHEPGNLRYDLFEKDGGTWLIFEYWADEAALAAHFAAPHSAAFLKDMNQFVEGNPEITIFQSVNVAH